MATEMRTGEDLDTGAESPNLLSGRGVGKIFGGLAALDDVDISVDRDEIVGLIGPNGAGKTTLFNCLTGISIPSSGTIHFKGTDLVPAPMTDLLKHLLKMSGFFIAMSIIWTVMVIGVYYEEAIFPIEFTIAMLSVGGFRVILGAGLRRAVPWTRGVSLLFGTLDAAMGLFWLLNFQEMFARRTLFGVLPSEYIMVPMAVIMVSYPAYYYLMLLRRDVKSLFGIFLRPDAVTRLGVARTFQNIRLFSNLTVLDNVKLGLHCRTSSNFFSSVIRTGRQRREEAEITEKAMAALKFVGLEHKAGFIASSLPYGEQRILEIARALATDPSLLLLDEPAAGMNPQETAALMRLIGRIRERGIAVLLIEHDMKVIMRISDRIVVLDHGRKIAEGMPEEIRSDPRVIEAYLGSSYAAG